MLENLLLFIIAILTTLFMGLLWLRHSLAHHLDLARQHQQILQSDFEHRRDIVPYLLEGARELCDVTDTWRKLAEDRAAFHTLLGQMDTKRELDFEFTLKFYLENTALHSIHFLDAKKEIEELNIIIEKEKQRLHDAVHVFNEQRKVFPYSLASTIFGFRTLGEAENRHFSA